MSLQINRVSGDYNFQLEKATQRKEQTVLIEQNDECLTVFVKTGESLVHEVPKWMIEGLPCPDQLPKAFFDQVIARVSHLSASPDSSKPVTYKVYFTLGLKGGMEKNTNPNPNKGNHVVSNNFLTRILSMEKKNKILEEDLKKTLDSAKKKTCFLL